MSSVCWGVSSVSVCWGGVVLVCEWCVCDHRHAQQ